MQTSLSLYSPGPHQLISQLPPHVFHVLQSCSCSLSAWAGLRLKSPTTFWLSKAMGLFQVFFLMISIEKDNMGHNFLLKTPSSSARTPRRATHACAQRLYTSSTSTAHGEVIFRPIMFVFKPAPPESLTLANCSIIRLVILARNQAGVSLPSAPIPCPPSPAISILLSSLQNCLVGHHQHPPQFHYHAASLFQPSGLPSPCLMIHCRHIQVGLPALSEFYVPSTLNCRSDPTQIIGNPLPRGKSPSPLAWHPGCSPLPPFKFSLQLLIANMI